MARTIAFFAGYTAATSTGLWETDGTLDGTSLVATATPDASGGNFDLTPLNGGVGLFGYVGGAALVASNGTASGTSVLASFYSYPTLVGHISASESSLADLTAIGAGIALFAAATGQTSVQLWTTDGTIAGTSLVKDFPGSASTALDTITPLGNGRTLFDVHGGTGAGLWSTDDTTSGTVELQPATSLPTNPVVVPALTLLRPGLALTVTSTASNAAQLGATDGTTAGTVTLGSFTSAITNVTPLGDGRALFVASQGGTTTDLWITDGTAAGTTRLLPGSAISASMADVLSFAFITPLRSGLTLFSPFFGTSRTQIWTTDGTTAGTQLVTDTDPGATNVYDSAFTAFGNGKALFTQMNFSSDVTTLWVTDGTAAGTTPLEIFAPVDALNPSINLYAMPDGKVLILSEAASHYDLGVTDGTRAGTTQIAQFPANDFPLSGFTQLPDGRVVLQFSDTSNIGLIYATDGTAAGTQLISSGVGVVDSGLTVATVPDINPLFDTNYYLATYPDVAAANVNAYQHYLTSGAFEGRDPDPYFDGSYYLAQNPDVKAAGADPLLHYEQYGWKEGRDPSLIFSTDDYLSASPDVAEAHADPLQHYLQYGQYEGRMVFLSGPSAPADPLVDSAYYDPQLGATLIPTGQGAEEQAAANYALTGWQKALNPDPLFNTAYYLAQNPDVKAAGVDPLLHYETYGWQEGRNPSPQFDTERYLAANPDVKAAGVDPLLQYVTHGAAEGRAIYSVT